MCESKLIDSINYEILNITGIVSFSLDNSHLFDVTEIEEINNKIKNEIIKFIENHGFNIINIGSSDSEIYFDKGIDDECEDKIRIIYNKRKHDVEKSLHHLSEIIEIEIKKFISYVEKMIDTKYNLIDGLIKNINLILNK